MEARAKLIAWEPVTGDDWLAKYQKKVTKIEKGENSQYFK